MEKLKTVSGKTFDCDCAVVIPEPARLYACIHNAPFVEVAQVFSDPAEIMQLQYGRQYFSNYTKLVSISQDGEITQIALARG